MQTVLGALLACVAISAGVAVESFAETDTEPAPPTPAQVQRCLAYATLAADSNPHDPIATTAYEEWMMRAALEAAQAHRGPSTMARNLQPIMAALSGHSEGAERDRCFATASALDKALNEAG